MCRTPKVPDFLNFNWDQVKLTKGLYTQSFKILAHKLRIYASESYLGTFMSLRCSLMGLWRTPTVQLFWILKFQLGSRDYIPQVSKFWHQNWAYLPQVVTQGPYVLNLFLDEAVEAQKVPDFWNFNWDQMNVTKGLFTPSFRILAPKLKISASVCKLGKIMSLICSLMGLWKTPKVPDF